MVKNPIVEEIRQRREQIAVEFNCDLQKLVEHLRAIEAENPDQVVDQVTVVRQPDQEKFSARSSD